MEQQQISAKKLKAMEKVKRAKGSGNTLQSSSQATGKNQKSIVSELY